MHSCRHAEMVDGGLSRVLLSSCAGADSSSVGSDGLLQRGLASAYRGSCKHAPHVRNMFSAVVGARHDQPDSDQTGSLNPPSHNRRLPPVWRTRWVQPVKQASGLCSSGRGAPGCASYAVPSRCLRSFTLALVWFSIFVKSHYLLVTMINW